MITPVQQRVFDYVKQYIDQYGYSPSLTEIAVGIGISAKSISLISRSVHALVSEGRLKFHKKGYRNIQVVDGEVEHHHKVAHTPLAPTALPLVGLISAGEPIVELADKPLIDLSWLLRGHEHFAYEVKGNSMVEDGVSNGDLVICRHAKHAEEGELVVALIDDKEAALSHISYKISDRTTLMPLNPSHKPKAYISHRVNILGVFVALLRFVK